MVFSKKIVGKIYIRVSTYTTNEEPNEWLMKLSKVIKYEDFKDMVLTRQCKLAMEGHIYMPYYNQDKWTERLQNHQAIIQTQINDK